MHTEDDGFTLIFTFEENSYFSPNVLKKAVYMKHKGIVDKLESTEIQWKDNCDPTKKKIQKKKKGKKIKQEVKVDSFFNFFKDKPEARPSEGDDDKEKDDDGAAAADDAEEELEMFHGEQLEMAEQIKDDLVPLALEYYLGVIDAHDDDDDDMYGEEGEGADDGADEGGKKKKKGAKGPDGKECKQQ